MLDATQTAARITSLSTLVTEIDGLLAGYGASQTKADDATAISEKLRALISHAQILMGAWTAPP